MTLSAIFQNPTNLMKPGATHNMKYWTSIVVYEVWSENGGDFKEDSSLHCSW